MRNILSQPYHPPQDNGLSLLYQDDWCVAINKPSGLLSVPGRGPDKQDCAHHRLIKQAPNARVVHRLDMGTSGILLFAQHYEAQKRLSQLFANREIQKKYIAVVSGHLSEAKGIIDAPMRSDWENRPKQMICEDQGKPSKTHFEVIEQSMHHARVALTPITGRTHQLRLHLQSIGHPILGDELYADEAGFKAAPRLLLHASELVFQHPVTHKTIHLKAPSDF